MDSFERTIYRAILMAAAIIGAIIIYFIISLIRHQRRHLRLYKQKVDAEITTLEKERTRLAADFHDDLGPLVSAVKFKLNGISVSSEEDEKLLKSINENLDGIIVRIRTISNGLMPNTLIRKGPVYAIEEFIAGINPSVSLSVELINYCIPAVTEEKAIHVYRILQEIIHNTIKHAQATNLKIQLYSRSNKLIIITNDDGIGFNYDLINKESHGIGLKNIHSRTELLGGTMQVNSKPGKGTSIIIELPVY